MTRLPIGTCREVDPIIVLLSPSPKREHSKLPILISCRLEQFYSIGSSIVATFFVSSTLTPFCFLLGPFRPFSARFGVDGPLCTPLLGCLRISIPVSVYNMDNIFVNIDRFPVLLTFLDWHRHTE